MAPFLVPCLRLYGGWQLRPVFPCPTLPQACLSVCLHTKFGSGPCLGAAPAGGALSIYQVRTTFFHCIASAWRKAPIIRRAGAAWAVLADTAHACAKSQREVVSGSTKQKNCTSTGTANKPYDTCLNHKQLHPPWTGEASCASYTGRYSDSGIQRGSRLPRA